MSILDRSIKRRDFLKGVAVTGATVAGTSLTGCSSTNNDEDSYGYSDVHVVESDTAIIKNKGEWLPMFCYENCGGACLNKGYVVDGVIIRQKTDDAYPDTLSRPQMRSCSRGHSLRQQLYNVDRLKYPMKRKNWQPGGGSNSNGHLRGKDEWERITWEQALDYVADEMKRVYKDYGPRSVLANAWRWETGVSLLKKAGGCITNADVESFGTWGFLPALLGLNSVWGDHPDLQMANDRFDMVNADYIVLYGANPVWCQGNFPNYYFKLAQEAGVKFVSVGSSRNISASTYDATWIQVRPGTDTAFLLAVIYEMLRIDQAEGNLIDWAFLNKYTVGFDSTNMPSDATLNEDIKDYVLGNIDGVAKTPQWATEICGTPVEDITWYARICGKNNDVMFLHSYVASRVNGAENVPQAFLTVAAMGGHFGRSGNACGSLFSIDCADSGPWLYEVRGNVRGNPASPAVENPINDNCNIEGPSWWKAILDGEYLSTAKGAHTVGEFPNATNYPELADRPDGMYYDKAKKMTVDAKILFAHKNNFLQTRQNLKDGIKAMRKVDLCVSFDIKTTLTVQFADIIFPISTKLEYNDDPNDGPLSWPSASSVSQRKDCIRVSFPLVKPIYETRTDLWVHRELCKRLGIDITNLYDVDNKVNFFDTYLGMEYLDKDGKTWKKAFSFTAEDAKKYGVDNPPQEGKIPYSQFIKDGLFTIERTANDNYRYIGYEDYIKDPVANPLKSRSGKFELYCQLKADNYNIMEINPEPIKPYANYIRPIDGYEDSFSDWDNKVKGNYPIQLYNVHYQRRAHTCYDNSEWQQEAFVNPVFMNASDGHKREINDGDTIMVKSKYGKTLRHAQLMESIMPGTAAIPHGPHSVLDESDPNDIIDRGGNEQILYGPVHSNYYPHLNGYNSVLVEIEKYDGKPIPKDYERGPFLNGTVAK